MRTLSRTADITRGLREEVLRGRFRPGERLPSERELASRFGTTRDVARVALKKLEQLGLATISQGGARVNPLSEASLDVVGHLLRLESPPDPALVDQVLEVVGALMAANVRMSVERAQPEAIERLQPIIARLREPGIPKPVRLELVHQMAHIFLETDDNVVMSILRRSLRTELFGPLSELKQAFGAGGEAVGDDPHELARHVFLDGDHVEEIARAVESRDGLAAYEAVHKVWTGFRRAVRDALETARGAEPTATYSNGAGR